jgi:uncharacterized cupin superfamily protein
MGIRNITFRKAGISLGALLAFVISVAAIKHIGSGAYDWSKLVPVKSHTGSVTEILKGPTRSLESFDIKAVSMHPGKMTHSYLVGRMSDELIIIKEGSAEITVNSVKHTMGEGSIIVASGSDRVLIKNTSSRNMVYYSFVFKPYELKTGKMQVRKTNPFFSSWDTITFRPSATGGRRNIIQKTTSVLKQLEIHTTTLKEGLPSHAAHTHPDEEIILVRFGTVDQTLNGNHFILGPGSVFFATNDDSHGISNAGKGPCEYYAIRWLTY